MEELGFAISRQLVKLDLGSYGYHIIPIQKFCVCLNFSIIKN